MKLKRCLGFVVIFFSLVALLPAQGSFSENFIRSYEAGQRARYYEEQIKLLELQQKQFKQELERAERELEVRQKEQKQVAPMTESEINKAVNIELEIFTAKHPDWKEYEKMMVHYGSKLLPNNISSQEFLDYLYILAKATSAKAEN